MALQRRGFAVEVAMSRASRRFVAPAALAAIAQREVHRSLWPATPLAPVPHVALAAWADLVVIYPASATTIARIAHGEFSDLVAAVALTTRAPVLAAPSMNPAMAEAPAAARNLDQLRADGIALFAPVPAIEVADAPEARAPVGGGCPPPGEVAATIDALVRAGALPRRTPRAPVPTDAAGWEATYSAPGADEAGRLPWVADACDPDLAAALAAHGRPPGPLLDAGCGLGQVARHAAAAGYHVVATDVSDTALALARYRGTRRLASPRGGPRSRFARRPARGPSRFARRSRVIWLRDDVAASALATEFAVVIDRACLHVLPRARHPAWAAAMRRLVAPGGVLLVKTHRPGAPYATAAFTRDGLAALAGDAFDVISIDESTIPGARTTTPAPAWLGVFRRRAEP